MLDGRVTCCAGRSEALLEARLEPLPPALRPIDFRLDCFLATASPPRRPARKAIRHSRADPVSERAAGVTPAAISARRGERSVAAVKRRLFERTTPEVLDLTFGCDPILEFVARFETASLSAVVRRFSDHRAAQIRPAPERCRLTDGPYRARVDRACSSSAFALFLQHLTRHSRCSSSHD